MDFSIGKHTTGWLDMDLTDWKIGFGWMKFRDKDNIGTITSFQVRVQVLCFTFGTEIAWGD